MQEYETNKNKPATIGYYDDNAVYLLPNETWHELLKHCKQEGTHFPFTKSTFYTMLKNQKLIAPDNVGNPSIQKKIHGKNQRVLKLIGGSIVSNLVTSVTDGASS